MTVHGMAQGMTALVLAGLLAMPVAAAPRQFDCMVAEYSGTHGARYVSGLAIQLDYNTGLGTGRVTDRHVKERIGHPVTVMATKISSTGVEVIWRLPEPKNSRDFRFGSLVQMRIEEPSGRFVVQIEHMDAGFERGQGTCEARTRPLS